MAKRKVLMTGASGYIASLMLPTMRDYFDLTLADVNRVMLENLKMDEVQYVFVTRDADDLKNRLIGNVPSPVTYDNEMPQELLQEDKLIESVSLSLSESDVSVISSDDVFK